MGYKSCAGDAGLDTAGRAPLCCSHRGDQPAQSQDLLPAQEGAESILPALNLPSLGVSRFAGYKRRSLALVLSRDCHWGSVGVIKKWACGG